MWGADPIPGEGEPARLVQEEGEARLIGVKTFCSGSTGLDRALVLVRGPKQGPPLLAYVDLSEGVRVDTAGSKAAGMRASESHRVVFEGAPVLAVLGEPGEIVREPYFSRDAIRTAVTWAGISDTAIDAALDVLAAKAGDGEPDDVVSLAAGRMLAAQGHHRQLARLRRSTRRRGPRLPAGDLDAAAAGRGPLVPGDPRRGGQGRRLPSLRRLRPARPGEAGSGALPPPAPPGARPGTPRETGHLRAATLNERLGREYFEGLYAESDDPWNFETSEYERNKYRRTLAVLGERTLPEGSGGGSFHRRLYGDARETAATSYSR